MQKATLGAEGWTKVGRRVFKANYIAEYMKVHGGEIPPESFFFEIVKLLSTYDRSPDGSSYHATRGQGPNSRDKKKKTKQEKNIKNNI